MAAVVEGAAWSPALSSDEVGKLLSGALSHDCALSFVGGALGGAPLAGPDGYRRFIEAWRGAVPDVKSSAHMIAHVPPAQASVVLVAWTRSGAFSGPAPLFGVAPTGAHLALHGVTVFPSEANMLLVRVPDSRRAFDGMKSRRVLVKHIAGLHPLLANCLRLTVGTPDENTQMIDALKASL